MPQATVDDVRRAQRILLYGVTGAGKSTAAARLGEFLDLPAHFVDDEIGWLPGWVERPKEEQIALAEALAAQPRWVLDSAYGSWIRPILACTDVVIALDYPRLLTLKRLVRRTAQRLITRQEMCNGNVETLRQVVASDSILVWHFKSFARKQERMRAWESALDGPPVLRLRHPREFEELLDKLTETFGA